MENASGTWHPKEGFQMTGVVPHHGGDAVSRFKAELCKRVGEAAGTPIEIPIIRAGDGFVRLAGDDLDARK